MPPHSGRVLVVEDEDTIGRILTEALADEGFEVRRARNGSEALEVLRRWVPQLILLDLMMPVMDGWTFRAAQQRLGEGVADVPVIILSAARETSVRTTELGVSEALSKPFELNLVVDAVARWIRSDPPGAE